MKNLMITVICGIIIALIPSGCSKDTPMIDKVILLPSLIDEYIEPEGLFIQGGSGYSGEACQIVLTGKKYTRLIEPEKYAALQREWNDIWVNGIWTYEAYMDHGISFIPYGLKKITVEAVDKYDNEHPEGSSLNDIFQFSVCDLSSLLLNKNRSESFNLSSIYDNYITFEGGVESNRYIENKILMSSKFKNEERVKVKFTIEFENKTISRIIEIPEDFIW